MKTIRSKKYDLIHAHYGLSGLLATLQKKTPVIVTFHGSDVNMKNNFPLSLLASRLSRNNIFVHSSLARRLKVSGKNIHIIPCGVDLDTFSPIHKWVAREKLGWIPKTTFEQLVVEMVREDIKIAERDELIKKHGYKAMDYHE